MNTTTTTIPNNEWVMPEWMKPIIATYYDNDISFFEKMYNAQNNEHSTEEDYSEKNMANLLMKMKDAGMIVHFDNEERINHYKEKAKEMGMKYLIILNKSNLEKVSAIYCEDDEVFERMKGTIGKEEVVYLEVADL